MGEVGSLSVRINAKTSDLEKSLGNVQKTLRNTGDRIGKTGKSMTKWVTGPIAGVAGALGGLMIKTGQWADELLDLSESTGMSTDTLQEWREVSKRAGTDQDAVAKGTDRLRRQYNDLADGQGTAAKGFEALGIDVKDAGGEMKDMETLMDEAMYALADVEDQSERNAIATEMFGGATKDILPILGDSSEELKNVRDQANVVDEDQLAQLDNFRESWDRLKGEFMDTARAIAADLAPMVEDKLVPAIKDHLLPFIEQAGEKVGDLIEWFMDLDPSIQKTIGVVIGLAAALGPILIVVGKIIGVVSALTPLFGALKVVFLALTGPIGLIVAAVAALIAIGWLLYSNWEEITDWLKVIWGKVKDFFIGLWDSIKEIFWGVLDWIKELFLEYHPAALIFEHWEEIKEFFSTLWDTVREIFVDILTEIYEFFIELWTKIKDWFFELLEDIKATVTTIWGFIDEYILDTARDIYNNIKEWIGKAIDWAADAWEGFKDTVEGVWDGITDSIKGAVNNIIGVVNGMIDSIESGINYIIDGINDFIDSVNDSLSILDAVIDVPKVGRLSKVSLGSIPTLHDGGIFRAPNPGGEGLAMLEDRERVIPAGMSSDGESVNIFVELDGRTIARAIGEPFVKEIRAKTGLRI